MNLTPFSAATWWSAAGMAMSVGVSISGTDALGLGVTRGCVVSELGDPLQVIGAMVAAALGVERDVGVGGGHDASRADAGAAVVPLQGRGRLSGMHSF